jgi:ATP-dependent DNA helicase RecQ
MITLGFLNTNLSIEEIAEKRELSVDTIITHLEKLQGLKQINHQHLSHLKNQIPENDFEMIALEVNKSEDGKLKPIYDKFEGKYSYDTIKMTRLLLWK